MLLDLNDRVLNLMAIDPGSSNLGVAIYSINISDLNIIKVESFTINAIKSKYYSKAYSKTYGDKQARFLAMKNELYSFIEQYNPSLVICESPFFSSFTASAYGILVELLYIISEILFYYNNNIPFYKVDPPTAKKAVGAKGNAKKEDMFVKVNEMKEKIKLINNIEDLDEHAIDAIAIGYYGYLNYILKYKG